MSRARSGWSLAAAFTAVVAGGAILLQAQDQPPARVQLQDVGPPGIDRGYIDASALRDPNQPPLVRRPGRRGRSGAEYVPGRIIVKFKSGTLTARALSDPGVTSRVQPDHADFEVLGIDPTLDAEAVASEWQQRDDIEYAQAAYVLRPYFRPNDPLYAQQWNLQVLGMEQAWDINPGASSSVVVAVLDSGLAYQNALYEFNAPAFTSENNVRYPALGRITVPFAAAPELAGASRFVAPHDFIWDDDVPLDFDGHGTHVAGTIGQLTNNGVGLAGMAYNVRLMPVKVIAGPWDDIFDSPFAGTDDVVARGIRYAADNGAKVINMSIGRDG
ncbi:MAG: S8 family serine peptidase, partial [Vicinamibacterales bacterium]